MLYLYSKLLWDAENLSSSLLITLAQDEKFQNFTCYERRESDEYMYTCRIFKIEF